MGLLKYTTEVPVSRSVYEIQEALRASGAQSITIEYDGAKQPNGLSFGNSYGINCHYKTFETSLPLLKQGLLLKQGPHLRPHQPGELHPNLVEQPDRPRDE